MGATILITWHSGFSRPLRSLRLFPPTFRPSTAPFRPSLAGIRVRVQQSKTVGLEPRNGDGNRLQPHLTTTPRTIRHTPLPPMDHHLALLNRLPDNATPQTLPRKNEETR